MFGVDFGQEKRSEKSYSYLPAQADWLKQILPMYGAQAGTGQNVYGGQRVAGLTPEQQEAMNVSGWSSYLDPNALATNLQYGQTGTALSGLLTGQMGAEPYTKEAIDTLFKSAYEAPARKQWQESTLPAIQEAYSGPGYWSTSRMREQSKAAQDLGDTLTSQYGQLAYSADQANKAIEEAKAGRALSAIPLGTAYAQAPTQQALSAIEGRGALYGLATPEQQQQQAEINAQIQKFAEDNRLTDPESMEI
ncbi:MAG: hypothetical protein ABFE01_29590, partial [Phycisphaerales bacterium]